MADNVVAMITHYFGFAPEKISWLVSSLATNSPKVCTISSNFSGHKCLNGRHGELMEKGFWPSLFVALPDIFDIVLMLAGVCIVVLAGGSLVYQGKPFLGMTADTNSRIALAVFGMILLGIGLAIRLRSRGAESVPKADEYKIAIKSPKPGDKVSSVDVWGDLEKLPPDGYGLWVFRLFNNNRFYPVRRCNINKTAKTWEAPNCDIGGRKGETRSFSVNLVERMGKL